MMPVLSFLFPRHASKVRHYVAVTLVAMLAMACSTTAQNETDSASDSVTVLYTKARQDLVRGFYQRAYTQFLEVENQHPYSIWTRRSLLMAAYAAYAQNKYLNALSVARRYITLHPGNENVSYAYYLIAQSLYEQVPDVKRSQKKTEIALGEFQAIVARFPQSDYAKDARLKILFLYDHLAGKEMEIGRFYLNRHMTLAALNRFTNVVRQFNTTVHIEEALYRMVEIYTLLGMRTQAHQAAAILGYNHRESPWYAKSVALVAKTP